MTKRSERDLDRTRAQLEGWLANRLGPGAHPTIGSLNAPSANGMSSESLMLEASWLENGVTTTHPLVCRVAPLASAVPVFPEYHLDHQFTLLTALADAGIPVPRVHWLETDTAHIGSPFFMMDRVPGRVPPDVMPYNFDSWVTEGSDDDRHTLMTTTLEVLARIHAFERPAERFPFLGSREWSGAHALRAHLDGQRAYYEWAREGRRIPILERGLDWLDNHFPAEVSPAVLCWGDSRIGNVLYDGWRPAAVLDWEMATLAPAELDVAWFAFLHRFFEDIAHQIDLPGLPNFLRRDDVQSAYEAASGVTLRDFDWYLAYAAVRHGIVMARTQMRAIHFGEITEPADPDRFVMHAATIDALLAGNYWSSLDS